jgi:hypothetical protein
MTSSLETFNELSLAINDRIDRIERIISLEKQVNDTIVSTVNLLISDFNQRMERVINLEHHIHTLIDMNVVEREKLEELLDSQKDAMELICAMEQRIKNMIQEKEFHDLTEVMKS